ncbi:Trypsin-1, partial [Pseudolycoriella hygida]
MVKLAVAAVLFLGLSQCFCAIPSRSISRRPRLDGRIVGGIVIDITDAPYTVSLQTIYHICGGSIISEKWILTAAHCTDGVPPASLRIRSGSTTHASNGTVTEVARIIQHPNFSFYTLNFDFALIELKTSLIFDSTMQPIELPEQDYDYPDDTPCIVSGWGNTQNVNESRDRLRATVVPTVNQEICSEAYVDFGGVTDQMICAGLLYDGGKDACQGDSGGPLASNGTLVGIVSWGYGCARPFFPGVYSRVAAARSWIRSNTVPRRFISSRPMLDERIVGGDVVDITDVPHIVSLQFSGLTLTHICGGVIISDKWIITAAHCVTDQMICAGLLHDGGKDACQGDSGVSLQFSFLILIHICGGVIISDKWIITAAHFLLLGLSQCFCAVPRRSISSRPMLDERIVGGDVVDITDVPHIVSLQFSNLTLTHICGGVIISDKWIITAAHCTDETPASSLKIRAGSTTHASNGTLFELARIIQHPQYSFWTADYDFSLIELETSLTFDSTMQPIELPEQDQEFPDDTPCIVSGWGKTKNSHESRDHLRSTVVPIVNQEICDEAYFFFGGVTDQMICAGLLDDGALFRGAMVVPNHTIPEFIPVWPQQDLGLSPTVESNSFYNFTNKFESFEFRKNLYFFRNFLLISIWLSQ